MFQRASWLVAIVLTSAGVIWAQQNPGTGKVQPVSAVSAKPDLDRLSLQQRQVYLSAQRGADWLIRANRPDGRFVHGYSPALRTTLDGDDFIHQAGGAFALARAARGFKDDKAAAIASQAILTLLLETTQDPKNPAVRYTTLPTTLLNRVGAAAMLVLAIQELPAPGKDLTDPAEQLCNYIRTQQRADGSLELHEDAAIKSDDARLAPFPAMAMYALARNGKPGDLRKSYAYYHSKWRQQRTVETAFWLTTAFAELHAKSPDKNLVDAVFEVNDWITTLQHERKDPRRPLWFGGFKSRESAPFSEAPGITSAPAAASLVEACRVARQAPDLSRLNRYRQAADQAVHFLTTLQYTEANTQHFAEWFRPVVVGAFHASHQEGDLRLDYSQHAVSAMIQYLQHATADEK